MSPFQFGFELSKCPSASTETSVRSKKNKKQNNSKKKVRRRTERRCQQQSGGKFQRASLMFFTYTRINCRYGLAIYTTLAKKIETAARTWHRRVIYQACTRLCLACVPVSIFLARVVYKPIKQQALQKHNRSVFLCICRFGDWNFSYCATLATKTFRLLPPWRVLLKRFFEPWRIYQHPSAEG